MKYRVYSIISNGIRQTIYWNQDDGKLYTDYDDTEAYGVSFATFREALEAADKLYSGFDRECVAYPGDVDNAEQIRVGGDHPDPAYTCGNWRGLSLEYRDGALAFWEDGYDYSDPEFWSSYPDPDPEFVRAVQIYDWLRTHGLID